MSKEEEERAEQARHWLLQASVATLCTRSAEASTRDFPFGSLVPFALTAEGAPFILIAAIAQHSKNLEADARASLFVPQPDPPRRPQAGWRLTLVGRMVKLDRETEVDEALHARYAERVPAAPDYRETHTFAYWRLDPERVRYIGGFGDIGWLPGEAVLRNPVGAGVAEARERAVTHMNEDHADALLLICEAERGIEAESARLVGLDRTGFFIRTRSPDHLLHFSFEREVAADDLRELFVNRTRAARERLDRLS